MANESLRLLICGVALGVSSVVFAQSSEGDVPDIDFLEYLGIWEESDEDWQLLDEDVVADNQNGSDIDQTKRSDPASDGKESTEIEDES